MTDKKMNRMTRIMTKSETGLKYNIWFFFASFFLIAFVYFFWFGDYVLFFQEHQSLFIYSREYLNEFFIKPGGLLELSGRFLTQFYISRLAGTVILSVVLTVPAVIFYRTAKKAFPGASLPAFFFLIPSGLMILMQTHYYHAMTFNLGFVFVLLCFSLAVELWEKKLNILVSLFFPLLYYFAGAYMILFSLLYISYLVFHKRNRRGYSNILTITIVTIVTIFIFKELIFNQTYNQILFYPLPYVNNRTHKIIYYILVGYLLLIPFLLTLPFASLINKLIKGSLSIVSEGIFFVLMVFLLFKLHNPQTGKVIRLEKLVFDEKWKEAVDYYERYPSNNLIGQYFYNVALSESGQLCERLFKAPQSFGTGSLILTWSDEHLPWGSFFFYSVGLINEAHRWAYEEMVVYGPRPQNMKMLTKTNLINGNYRMARKYTGLMKKTLFYRKWAEQYSQLIKDTSAIRLFPEIAEKARIIPGDDFFIFLEAPETNLPVLIEGNKENRKAFEYIMAWGLLSKNVEAVVDNVKMMKEMGFNSIPRHIEEAILIYYNSKRVFPDLGGLKINPATLARFDQYFASYLEARKDPAHMEQKMREKFSDTFWYYFHFK